ncbi:MAG: ERCC4 domain-containing protein [Methanosarcinales archaeon]
MQKPYIYSRMALIWKIHLASGDYVIISDIGIERKTCSDFINSFTKKDKRLWRQLHDLKHNFQTIIYSKIR